MDITRTFIVCCVGIIGLAKCASIRKINDANTDKLTEDGKGFKEEKQHFTDTGKPKTFSLPFYILPSGARSRGFASLGLAGTRAIPMSFRAGKRTAGFPYYSLPSGQRAGMTSLGIGSSGYPGKRTTSDILSPVKRVASFLPSYVIPSETSRRQRLASLGIGSGMFRNNRNKTDKRSTEEMSDDDKVLADMADILSYLKTEVDNEQHERLMKQLDELVETYSTTQ